MKTKRIPQDGARILKLALQNLGDKQVQVGWFESSKYEKTGIPVAYVAAIQEFGDPSHNIPPRSFMRTTIKEKTREWKLLSKNYAQAILRGESNTHEAMEGIGQQAQADIQAKISSIYQPELKDSTIAARRRRQANKSKNAPVSKKPLVDSGYMLSTVNRVVIDKK